MDKMIAAKAAYEAYQSAVGLGSNWGGLSEAEVKAWQSASEAAITAEAAVRSASGPPSGGGHDKP